MGRGVVVHFVARRSGNVGSASEVICAPRCATTICLLICDKMEIPISALAVPTLTSLPRWVKLMEPKLVLQHLGTDRLLNIFDDNRACVSK